MNLEKATRWQRTIGRAGALFCVLFILAGFDGLISQFRTPPNEFRALPGETVNVNGPCSSDIQDISQLAFESSSEGIRLQFEAMQAGFWLGGTMWRGVLVLSPDVRPGDYQVTVKPVKAPLEKPFSVFAVKVFPSVTALRQASRSFVQRQFGFSPWLVCSVFIGFTAVAFAAVYGISQKRDSLMAFEGRAEIYRLAKGEEFFEVGFGLGAVHGVHTGDVLTLLNKHGERVGEVKVTEAFEQDSAGTVDLNTLVKPGFSVLRSI